MKISKEKLPEWIMKMFSLTAPSLSAPSTNSWGDSPLEERIQLGNYSFIGDSFRSSLSRIHYGTFKNEDVKPEGWYCDYCGNKNLDAVEVCADCLKYNGGEVDVF